MCTSIVIILPCLLISVCRSELNKNDVSFSSNSNNERKIFYNFGQTNDLYSSNYSVVNILVPLNGYTEMHTGNSWYNHPPIFFNLIDHKAKGENYYQGQYVLLDKIAYRIFDGRDSTFDRSVANSSVYFAGRDGIYVYNAENKSADKYGSITNNVLSIEKTLGRDELYILGSNHKIYRVTKNGTVKKKIKGIGYAKDFTIDSLGAIYYYSNNNKPQVLRHSETVPQKFKNFKFEIENPFFVQPSLNYNFNVIIFIANGVQYFLSNCTRVERIPDTGRIEGLTGYNTEGFFYQFLAANGNLYEHYLLMATSNLTK